FRPQILRCTQDEGNGAVLKNVETPRGASPDRRDRSDFSRDRDGKTEGPATRSTDGRAARGNVAVPGWISPPRRRPTWRLYILPLVAVLLGAAPAPRSLDEFEDLSRWKAVPSDGIAARISSSGGVRGQSLRLDYDFKNRGGYAVI